MKKSVHYLILLINIFSFILPASANELKSADYKQLIKKYQEVEKLQNENFKNLIFELSPDQIKKSVSFKFVFQDQLGRKWLFKSGPHSSKDGAIAIYRLFMLLGVDTPEIHEKEITLNGEKITGSFQRLYEIKDRPFQYSELNPKSLEYIAKNHALAYLALNSHTHSKQFILLENEVNGLQVMRIDNSVTWFTLGHDLPSTMYYSPLLLHAPNSGYFNFWNSFLAYDVYNQGRRKNIAPTFPAQGPYLEALKNKSYNLDLEKIYSWILFVKNIPDHFYGSFFEQMVKNNFEFASNGSNTSPWFMAAEYMLNFDRKNFIANIVARKNQADRDFRLLYAKLLKAKDQKFDLKKVRPKVEYDDTLSFLENKMQEAKEIDKKIKMLQEPGVQKNIETNLSLSSHMIFSRILTLPLISDNKMRKSFLEEVILDLTQRSSLTNAAEKSALTTAIGNLRDLQALLGNRNVNSRLQELVLGYHHFFEENDYIKKYFSKSSSNPGSTDG